MIKNLMIAFLLGIVFTQLTFGLKVPDIPIPATVAPEVKEIIEDYIVRILNAGSYQIRIRSVAVTSSTGLKAGVISFDNEGATKYLTVSNGSTNYRVQLTAIP